MKPIIFELTNDDESRNTIGGDEVLIIKQWENTTLYFNCRRIDGVIDDIDYCQTVNQTSDAEFHESLAAHYTCRGFAPDGYLTGVFSTEQEEEKMDYEHLTEVVGSLMIDQFKGDDKQDQYRSVINEIFKQYKDRDV